MQLTYSASTVSVDLQATTEDSVYSAQLVQGTTTDLLLQSADGSDVVFESLAFNMPTDTLTIVSSDADVTLDIRAFAGSPATDMTNLDITIQTENIIVSSGVSIGSTSAKVGRHARGGK